MNLAATQLPRLNVPGVLEGCTDVLRTTILLEALFPWIKQTTTLNATIESALLRALDVPVTTPLQVQLIAQATDIDLLHQRFQGQGLLAISAADPTFLPVRPAVEYLNQLSPGSGWALLNLIYRALNWGPCGFTPEVLWMWHFDPFEEEEEVVSRDEDDGPAWRSRPRFHQIVPRQACFPELEDGILPDFPWVGKLQQALDALEENHARQGEDAEPNWWVLLRWDEEDFCPHALEELYFGHYQQLACCWARAFPWTIAGIRSAIAETRKGLEVMRWCEEGLRWIRSIKETNPLPGR